MLQEGLAIARRARDRYDGVPRKPIPRNPWSEIECGGHYVRSMASWLLLTALAGYSYDGPAKRLGFAPKLHPERFRCFFTGAVAWGTFAQELELGGLRATLEIAGGELELEVFEIESPLSGLPHRLSVVVDHRPVQAFLQVDKRIAVRFERVLQLRPGTKLQLEFS